MVAQTADLERAIWDVLETIDDPELPVSIIDLGLITNVAVVSGRVRVTMVPTFSACPAIAVMREDVRRRVRAVPGVEDVQVELSFAEPWTMARMTERGRERLQRHGLSVPRRSGGGGVRAKEVQCPFCGSTNTRLENLFGPTLCRAIYYCLDCKNPIERFRPPAD